MNRSATAPLHSATPKKNVPCFLDLAGVKFLLKKERVFFSGLCLPSIQAGGGTMRTKFVFECKPARKEKRRVRAGLPRDYVSSSYLYRYQEALRI